jgi:hypothetical protein
MFVITDNLIEILRVMFKRSFDVMSDIKSNDAFELLGREIGDLF